MFKLGKSFALVASALAGSLAALCAVSAASAQDTPQIVIVPSQAHPAIPAGLKVTCLVGPDTLNASPTCPAILYKGNVTWAYSYIDNRVSYGLVTYDQPGVAVQGNTEASGARYVYEMTVDPNAQTVSIWGQANAKVDVSWSSLPVPPPALPTYGWYVALTPPANVMLAPAAPNKAICKGLDAQNNLWAGWWNGAACVGSQNGQQHLATSNFQFLVSLAGTPLWPAFTGAPPPNAINAGQNAQGQDQYLCSQNGYVGWINGAVCDFAGAPGPTSSPVALQGQMN